jgi:putative glutamine amidotransferase
MKQFLSAFFLFIFSANLVAQDFFREKFDTGKTYILLANPTVRNLETVTFLIDNNLLNVNKRKTRFVGIYHEQQAYDFEASRRYVETRGLNRFYLHEIRGKLDTTKLYLENGYTAEMKKLFENSAGIFFFGGPDIPPAVYGEKNTRSVITDPARHYFEITFLFHLLGSYRNNHFEPFLHKNPDYFVSGFCLGMQTMNVATGGTLIQDIPAEIYGAETPEATVQNGKMNMHRNYWQKISTDSLLMTINFHPIRFTEHPFFGERVKVAKTEKPLIYSSHHQAAEKIGKGLEVTAVSNDGKIVEALTHTTYPHVFAVQFHPEVPALYENQQQRKFHPDDTPQTYHELIGRQNVKFHKKYWRYISKTLKKAAR